MAGGGQARLWVKVAGMRPGASHTEAEQGYETRVLHQVLAQVPHRLKPLVELDQHRPGESGI